MKRILLILLLILVPGVIIYAHPGSTDIDGGHIDHSYGSYHYHHGYPAHQHVNGECPYDFKDISDHSSNTENKENENNSASSISKDNAKNNVHNNTINYASAADTKKTPTLIDVLAYILVGWYVISVLYKLIIEPILEPIAKLIAKHKNKSKKKQSSKET